MTVVGGQDQPQAPQDGATGPVDISQVPPSPGRSMKMTSVTNITNEDYETAWNGEAIFLKAGETQQMPEWLARHVAHGLAKREVFARKRDAIVKKRKPGEVEDDTGIPTSEFEALVAEILAEPEMKAEEAAPAPKQEKPAKPQSKKATGEEVDPLEDIVA